MALCICDYCGKPFNSLGSGVCAECADILDDAYSKARKYIYQNPRNAKFTTIIENTEIPEKALSFLITQHRIVIDDTGGSEIKCRACGKATSDGPMCRQCKAKLSSESFFSETNRKTDSKTETKKDKSGIVPLSYK